MRLQEDNGAVLRMRDTGDGTHSVPVAVVSSQASPSAGTDRSLTAGTTSQVLFPANPNRKCLYIKNDTTIDVWINPSGTAVAAAGGGNIKIPANGAYFEFAYSTGIWSIIAASGAPAITAREF